MGRIKNTRQGFALIVVLSTLSIIALLFAIASSRAIGRLSETRTDLLIAEGAVDRAALLALAVGVYGAREGGLATDEPLPVTWRGEAALLRLQDAGGLIDLNTANPAMLELFALSVGLSSAQLESYRRWRRTPFRLQRASDFFRVAGVVPEAHKAILRSATVFSGRPGIAPELAPLEVLEQITGKESDRAASIRDFPPGWVSPPSGVNYHVNLIFKDQATVPLGVINLSGTGKGLIISSF